MRGVVGVVVDAERRAVGEQDVDGAELAQQLAGLLLAPRVARLAPVLVAAGEAAEAQPGDLDAPQVDALDAEARELAAVVVVAVDAELGQLHAAERLEVVRA